LRIPRNTIENVSASVGFKSADAFSRAFERQVGVRPSAYPGRRGVAPAENFPKPQSETVEPYSFAHALGSVAEIAGFMS
jgi:AraC-like DNA-binding protein